MLRGFHGRDVGAGRVWKAMDAFCTEEMLTKSRTVGLLPGAHGRRGPRRPCTGHGMLSLHPRGSTGESRQLRDSQALGREGRARWEVAVHTAVPWDIRHENRSYGKGTLRIPDWSRAGDAFPTVPAMPQSVTRGCRGLLLIFSLSGVLCFPRRHQNAQGFCLLASSNNLVLMVLHSWEGFKIRQPLAEL